MKIHHKQDIWQRCNVIEIKINNVDTLRVRKSDTYFHIHKYIFSCHFTQTH